MAAKKRGRGRPAAADGQESYRVGVTLSADECNALAAWAERHGMTRKAPGEARRLPDYAGAARAILRAALGLEGGA